MSAEITIPQEEFDTLKKDSDTLAKLMAAGVQDWDGYHDAIAAGVADEPAPLASDPADKQAVS